MLCLRDRLVGLAAIVLRNPGQFGGRLKSVSGAVVASIARNTSPVSWAVCVWNGRRPRIGLCAHGFNHRVGSSAATRETWRCSLNITAETRPPRGGGGVPVAVCFSNRLD